MLLQEVREMASFVLDFIDDNVDLMENSYLSISPTLGLGKDRVSAIQLSSIIVFVLITAFIQTFASKPLPIDVLPLTLVCVVYLSLVAFLVARVIGRFQGAANKGAPADERDIKLDSNSYVLFFNSVALFVFAVMRELIYREFFSDHRSQSSQIPSTVGAILGIFAACALILASRKSVKGGSNLTGSQKLAIVVLLTLGFIFYIAIVAGWPTWAHSA